MSLLLLNDPKESLLSESAYVGRGASFDEMVYLSYRNQVTNFNADSSAFVRREVRNENAKLYEQLTGEPLSKAWLGNKRAARNSQARLELEDAEIKKLKEENPNLYSQLKTSEEIEVEAKSRATKELSDFQQAWEYTPSAFTRYAGGFFGGAGGALTDPIQWPTLAVGSSYAVGSSVLRNFAIEATAGALSELASQPSIMQWQEELGNNYGIKDASLNVLLGAVTGGTISLPLSAYAKVRDRNAMLLRELAENPELSDRIRAAVDSLADVAEHNANAPSPDLARHNRNAEAAVKSLGDGETYRNIKTNLDEFDTRITDEIDGLPSEAFKFLDPDATFKITTTSTPVAKGSKVKLEPIVKVKEKKLSQMTKAQIRQVVETDLLPKILDEMRGDYATVARRLGKAQDTKIQTELYKVNEELATIQRQLKDNKQNIRFRRERLLARAEKPRQKATVKSEAKAETNKLNQEYNKRKIELEESKFNLEQKRNILGLQKNRKEVMKDLAKGVVPSGDDYVSTSVRNTIDKVVDAATANKKSAWERLDAIEQSMKDTGIIKKKPRPVDEVVDELDEAEKMITEEVDFQLSKLDESDLDENIFDRDGNVTTIRKIMEDAGKENEVVKAMTSCLLEGGK